MEISENRDRCLPAEPCLWSWNSGCISQDVPGNRTLFITVLVLGLSASCSTFNTPSTAPKANASSPIDVNAVPGFVSNDDYGRSLWDSTKQVYTLRQFRPVWSGSDAVDSNSDAALRVLENASAEGLHPEDFGVADLRRLYESLTASTTPEVRNEFDTRLSYALVRYVSELCFGRIDPRAINPDWPASDTSCDVPQIVNDAIANNTVENLASEHSPKLPEYQGLRSTLARYREIDRQGGWQPLAPELARTLALLGDLSLEPDGAPPSRKALNEALRHFQERNGLEPDGRLGKKTIDALSLPVSQRIEQIEINMDRMRWIAHRLEPRHIRVNIPGFQLSVYDGEQIPLQMRAIVGSEDNPTPVLDGTLEYLVFSPYWNIPLSIATKELLPKIQKSPAYLKRENIEVVRVSKEKVEVIDPSKIKWENESDLSGYQLRQKPGATNALGLVKFIFPNPYNVYLHDTPSENLFYRLTRTLSHGCVRVERPADLAGYLLSDQPEWTPVLIEEAMHEEKERRVSLKTRMPIHLLYWTAWTDQEGNVQFREDVYGYDEKHRELTGSTKALPAAHAPNIDVHKVGTRVVTDPSSLHR
jgi:murein L,D-transpeptidase YcbB/YkuD